MVWRNRSGIEPEQKFDDLERELGLENLTDVQVDEANSFLYIFTETKKFRIAIIVPFRDLEKDKPRTKQLNAFVNHMKTYF
jgi:hypothetical protein